MDKRLFERVAAGEEKAFEELFYQYLPLVQPVILQIVKSESVTKDLVQEIFLKLWLKREKLIDVEQERNYIFRIVYNTTFTYLEKKLVEKKTLKVLTDGIGPDMGFYQERNFDSFEINRLLKDAIKKLPPQAGHIYQLNRIDGFKPQEIANQLGISVQSVRNSLTRSNKVLRTYLTEQGIVLPVILIILFY